MLYTRSLIRQTGFLLLAVLSLELTACGGSGSFLRSLPERTYYLEGSREQKQEIKDLFTLLDSIKTPGEERFCVVREIAEELSERQQYAKTINFLGSWVDRHPEDPYNTWFLMMIAYTYLDKLKAPSMAAHYFDRIVKNCKDLTVQGQSVHYDCLNKLLELETDSEQRIWYYQELISRFPDRIDLGVAYFLQAQAYEKTGDWDLALRTYTKYLPYYESTIPGFPDAFAYAKKLVDFNNSPKDWGYEHLGDLIADIKAALDAGDSSALQKIKAKVNFFDMDWNEEEVDSHSEAGFRVANYMEGETIHYSQELDPSSNPSEAFLKTWGWSQRISTWYLYFRKIHFPADPEIHGRWEWAGIYYGEKIR